MFDRTILNKSSKQKLSLIGFKLPPLIWKVLGLKLSPERPIMAEDFRGFGESRQKNDCIVAAFMSSLVLFHTKIS